MTLILLSSGAYRESDSHKPLATDELYAVAYLLLVVFLSTLHLQNPPDFAVHFSTRLHGKASIALITAALSATTLAQIFATGLMARKAWSGVPFSIYGLATDVLIGYTGARYANSP